MLLRNGAPRCAYHSNAVSPPMPRQRVVVRDVSKVFGRASAVALDLLRSGESKDAILARTAVFSSTARK